MKIQTPHISAAKEDFAPTVLMPGDPLRAQFIAEHFLEKAVLVNQIRGMLGYTGFYHGKRVSVMGSGMGMPSMGIYSHELFNTFGVESIVRIGTAGALTNRVKLREMVLAMTASTNSAFGRQFRLPGDFAPGADYGLLEKAVEACRAGKKSFQVGAVLSSDTFYDASNSTMDWARMGVLAVEMETAALYMNAAASGKRALAILTISDSLATGEACTPQERQETFLDMMEVALEIA